MPISGSSETIPRSPSVPPPSGLWPMTISMLSLKPLSVPRGPPWRSYTPSA
ncbi:MAG: hypothetical protein ACHQ51_13725 [Elusimicrobiota bacterium]